VHTTLARALRRLALFALAAALVAAAGLAAGCGSSSSAGDADPAVAIPASAPLYAEAVLRPDGTLGANVDAVARKVLATDDPAGKIAELFDRAARNDGLTFRKDVEPWLGKRAGAAVTSLSGTGKADGVLVLASKDDDLARKTIASSPQAGAPRSYNGVDYRLDAANGTAIAVTGGRVLIGSERGLHAAIDAIKGDSLGGSAKLKRARDAIPGDQLGFLYLDVRGFVQAAASQAGMSSGPAAALLGTMSASLPQTIAARVGAQPDAITINAAAIGLQSTAEPGAGGAAMLTRLPRSSWLALGVGNLGRTLDDTLTQVSSSGLGGLGVEALLRQFRQRSGLDVRRDLLAWMGDAGIFVSGTSTREVGFGLVVDSKDAAATRRAVGKLARLAGATSGALVGPLTTAGVDAGFTVKSSGGPEIFIAAAGDRFVIAAGRPAFEQALAPTETLGTAPAFAGAAAKLGGGYRPAFFLDMPQVTRLIGDAAGSDARFARAKPYLDAFGGVVAGARRDGDVSRARIVATVR
jgi:Protein of unknown function (DUF3352)